MNVTPAKILVSIALAALLASAGAAAQKPDASQKIDRILAKEWKDNGLEPNAITTDEVFVRRVYLDVAGRIPTYEEATTFLNSKAQDKRAQLIDDLLESEGYVNHFFNYWADILRINNNLGGGQNITPFYIDFVREALESNMPYDQFVSRLITAEGQAIENGAIGYSYRDRGMPLDHMANTVRIFLGTRLECAQCHNHPFDTWTQMDFYKMAAFSYGMNSNAQGYAGYGKIRSEIGKIADNADERRDMQRAFQELVRPLRNNNRVEYQNRLPQLPHDYQYTDAKPKERVGPAVMFGGAGEVARAEERLQTYAEWMTSPENPRFTTVIANRLWKKLMGIGIYEPVDEFMAASEPSNAALMKHLEDEMVASGYDMKDFLRMVLNSDAYQREATTKEVELGEPYHFTGPVLRRMTAEQIWDSVVTLVNPNPEMEDWKRDQQQHLRVEQQMRMQEVVENKTEEELIELTRQVARYQEKLREETEEMTKKAQELRAEGKSKEANELAREAGRLRNKLRDRIEEMVYEPGLKELGVEYAAMELPNGESMDVPPQVIKPNGQISSALRRVQDRVEEELIQEEMDARGVEDEQLQKRYMSMRKSAGRYLRAAHLSSPAPDSHFLRMFGQSDRETIENASSEASVPQVLNLMNGPDFPQVSGNNSYLTWQLEQVDSMEDKIDMIFLSMLSRKPTEEERGIILSSVEQRGEKVCADAIFALMNGHEFLYVQ